MIGGIETGSDPFGFVPSFVWQSPSGPRVDRSLTALLAAGAPALLDVDALAVFVRVGFFVGDDTPFVGVRAASPSRGPVRGPAHTLSRAAAVDGFIDVFRAAMHRRLPRRPFQMPLSGGRDSRHILLALHEAGALPDACLTIEHFPPRGNDDILIARALCARLGVRHVVVPQRRDRVHVEREKNHRTHFCSDEHAQFVALADYLHDVTAVTYDGIAGDVLSQSSYLTPEAHRAFGEGAERAATFVLDGYGTAVGERALDRLLAPRLRATLTRERAIVRLAREIARHLDAPNPVASFFFWNRTRREIALSPFALMHGVTVHAPYLDDDVYGLLSGLPAALLMDRRLHTDAIARAYPGFADVPYEAKTRQVRRPGFHRRTAFDLLRLLGGALPHRGLSLRLLPGVAATVLDGDSDRLWHVPLTVYLAQLSTLVARAA